MTNNDDTQQVLLADARTLLDSQIHNLSERLYETGRLADRQLTAWLTFAALTVLIIVGASGTVTIGGIGLRTNVAAAVTYGLSCVFYYRTNLSTSALDLWRTALRERRQLRFDSLLQVAKQLGDSALTETHKDVRAFISEYPGYVFTSVNVKQDALTTAGALGIYIDLVHRSAIMAFVLAPYALAAGLVIHGDYSPAAIVIALVGLAFTLSGNALIRLDAKKKERADAAGAVAKAP